MDRVQFKQEAKKSIDGIFARIKELEAKRDAAKDEVKAKYDRMLAQLNTQKDELQAKYNQLANASEDKWEEVKDAWSDASTSFKEGVSKLAGVFN